MSSFINPGGSGASKKPKSNKSGLGVRTAVQTGLEKITDDSDDSDGPDESDGPDDSDDSDDSADPEGPEDSEDDPKNSKKDSPVHESSIIVDDEDEDEFEEEDEDEEPEDYRPWEPFKEIRDSPEFDEDQLIIQCERMLETHDWEIKQMMVLRMLDPFIRQYPKYSRWVEDEIRQIFEEASAGELPKNPKRYIENTFDIKDKEKSCPHEDECACWFDVSAEAGIPNFSETKDRKACISFAHRLISELLMVICTVGVEFLRFEQKWVLKEALITIGHDEVESDDDDSSDDSSDDDDNDDDEMIQFNYLTDDSSLSELWHGLTDDFFNGFGGDRYSDSESEDEEASERDDDNSNPEGLEKTNSHGSDGNVSDIESLAPALEPPKEPSRTELQMWKLCATLGRRGLALSVCRFGLGHLFTKRVTAEFYNFTKLFEDIDEKEQDAEEGEIIEYDIKKYLETNPKNPIEQPRLPTRVIDTETYMFEDDKMLYQNNYAILSHMWNTQGRGEVLYERVGKVLADAKIKQVKDSINHVEEQINEAKRQLELFESKNFSERRSARQKDVVKMLEEKKENLEAERIELEKKGGGKHKIPETESELVQDEQPPPEMTTFAGIKRVDTAMAVVRALTMQKKPSTNINQDLGELKLINAVKMARKMKYRYLWMDSCCINKPNNTELVEAISSMGDWYENAKICLVYLEDVEQPTLSAVKKTKWSERGWTLQEVVLCKQAVFFNKHWKQIADSNVDSKAIIAKLCRIPKVLSEMVCCGRQPDVAASAIMKLASKRRTTRPEDRAYSLMGIMGVRLMPAYGEGQAKAIGRLLKDVVRTTGDVSVFNWVGFDAGSPESGRTMFPVDFDGYTDVGSGEKPLKAHSSITLGHIGVHARFDIWRIGVEVEGNNQKAMKALEKLEELHAKVDIPRKNDIDCHVSCTLRFDDKGSDDTSKEKEVEVTVLCPMSVLKTQLEVELLHQDYDNAPTNWVMARFAGVEGANWFLCELGYESKISEAAMFAEAFKSQATENSIAEDGSGIKIGDMSRVMHYLESAGFLARRLATAHFEQDMIPTGSKKIQNVNLWIG